MNKAKNQGAIDLMSLIIVMIAALILPLNLAAQTKRAPQKTDGKPLPNLILNTIDGAKWSLHENRGSVVLLNFWATWCEPCRTEIPVLVRLSEKYKDENFKVAGVNIDSENINQINAFIENYKMSYPVLLTVPGSLLSQQKAVPMSLLIDKSGVLAKKYVGAIKKSIFERDIQNLLSSNSLQKKTKTPLRKNNSSKGNKNEKRK